MKPSGVTNCVGLCLEPHDLCAAKILANREKDLIFVSSLLQAGLIDSATLKERIERLDPSGVSGDRIQVALNWAAWAVAKYPPPS